MRKRKLIHVVDDDEGIRNLLHRALSKQGYTVRGLPSGVDLEQILVSERPDLIIMDVMLPHATGFDVLARLDAFGRIGDTPVLITSALPQARLRFPRRFEGVPFLPKPFLIEDVRRKVEEAIRAGERPRTCRPAPSIAPSGPLARALEVAAAEYWEV